MGIPKFPVLQKKEKDKTRLWSIKIVSPSENKVYVETRMGEEGGKMRKTKPNYFKDSKQKSAIELAITHARMKWTGKIRDGYSPVKKVIGNVAGKKVELRTAVLPMGAVPIEKFQYRIKYPVWVQPKLDGYRGMAFKDKNKINIVSRKGLPFDHIKLIKDQLSSHPWFKKPGAYLDGELYIHGSPIGDLKTVLGRKHQTEESKRIESKIKFIVFDGFNKNDLNQTFGERWNALEKSFKEWKVKPQDRRIELVNTIPVKDASTLSRLKEQFLKDGYEGVVAKNDKSIYKPGKKSSNIFRTKEFQHDKFQIVGAIQAKGDNIGTVVWVVRCAKNKDETFFVRPKGTREERRDWYDNRKKYIGKWLEVKYMEIDPKSGCVSRFPVGIKFVDK